MAATNQTVYSTQPVEITLNSVDLNEITNIPDLGASPNRIDVTRTGAKRKRYIPGQEDTDIYTIEMNYNTTDFATVKAAKTASATAAVPIVEKLPDGRQFSNTCIVNYHISGGGPDDALKMTVDCELQADWVETEPSP